MHAPSTVVPILLRNISASYYSHNGKYACSDLYDLSAFSTVPAEG